MYYVCVCLSSSLHLYSCWLLLFQIYSTRTRQNMSPDCSLFTFFLIDFAGLFSPLHLSMSLVFHNILIYSLFVNGFFVLCSSSWIPFNEFIHLGYFCCCEPHHRYTYTYTDDVIIEWDYWKESKQNTNIPHTHIQFIGIKYHFGHTINADALP